MQGSCHCGNVIIDVSTKVNLATSCNCSLCHRYGAIWGYFEMAQVNVAHRSASVQSYKHGDEYLDFHHCTRCGCITHYTPTEKAESTRMAVNLRMFDKTVLQGVEVRYFDGADTWEFKAQSADRYFI
ncbi:GFA family protein [Pseudoalteromonas sp. SMS1]|uniref:GFA family protein n=1 Tax=Pseudoalteromonas sp. SMS1 TaxID=2908894 RepID=UPI001F309874|nr:aldehyde-activating protein [Pseudoalteromonas sp. SMS1]